MRRFDFRSFVTIVAVLAAAQSCRSAGTGSTESASGAPADGVHQIRYQGDFRAPLGVQLWTFREQAKADPKAMMDLVRRMGFTHVETAGLYDMPAEQFADAINKAGLKVTSMHTSYEDFRDRPETVIANAKALGARYVGIAWYPHQGSFTEADARRAIADFNQFGRRMKDAGLTFFYHNHGYEPVPYGNGTLLDLIIQETDPALVSFQMDVLWTWHPGVDPVALIRKYPGRFKLMHIKDTKPGVRRGSLSGELTAEEQAVIGQGQVNWAQVMAAAQKDGFEHYYLEDETPDPVNNAPKSISFLERLKY